MHDIRAIRNNPTAFDAALAGRGLQRPDLEMVKAALSGAYILRGSREKKLKEIEAAYPTKYQSFSALVLQVDQAWRQETAKIEKLQQDQNSLAKASGTAKSAGRQAEFEALQLKARGNRRKLSNAQKRLPLWDRARKNLLLSIPNLPLPDVPEGADESGNVEIRRWGTPRAFAFPPKEHFDIPGARAGLDFATAARLSGSRFVVLRGAVARLHRALAQFMLDIHTTEHGLAETWAPVLVKEEAMYGTNQLPKFAEDSYRTTEGRWLIPTSEVTLTNTVAGEILDEAALPIRLTAHSQCFRSEAGSAGKDTAGMLRQHQFEKVEMVSITTPEASLAEHDRMTACAEAILQKLGLPYRVVVLCTGDMGFGARKTHDLEVWLPGQDTYREISSVSVCGDFQARRMNARYRPAGGRPEYVHTLNGSGLAVGRTLIAVLENGQERDGSVALPEALWPWLGGRTRITSGGALA
jgi:seryl-tRNA synthetase